MILCDIFTRYCGFIMESQFRFFRCKNNKSLIDARMFPIGKTRIGRHDIVFDFRTLQFKINPVCSFG